MRIEKVRIQNFRCIRDSGEIPIKDDIICLIGRNERGKTTFLKALESFNSDLKYNEEDISSYSKVKEKLDSDKIEAKDIEMVTIWFKTEDDRSKISMEEIHEGLSRVDELKVIKYFDNHYEVEIVKPNIQGEDLEKLKNTEKMVTKTKSQIDKLSKNILSRIRLLNRIDKQKHINFLKSLQTPDGGFSHVPGPGQPSHINHAYFAIKALMGLGALRQRQINKQKLIEFVLSTQHSNGGFGYLPGQPPQAQETYNAIILLKELKALDKIDKQKHINFLKSLQTPDGGFSPAPGQPSHITYSYFAIKALMELGASDQINKQKLIEFVLSTQHSNGGFGYLPGQPPQAQETYNAIILLKELKALDKIDKQKHINFIKSLQTPDGGFSHAPGQPSHIAYSYFAIKALMELGASDQINKQKLIEFVLSTQYPNGGFGHLPGQPPQAQLTCNAILILKGLEELAKHQHSQAIEEFLSVDFTKTSEVESAFGGLLESLKNLQKDRIIGEDIKSTIKQFVEIKDRLIEAPDGISINEILKLMPSFIYFEDIDILKEDTVDIDEFLKNKSKYKTFDNLLRLVGLNAEELKAKKPSQQRNYTRKATGKITGEINEFWKQGKYEVEITYNTPNLLIMIKDETSAEPTPPSKRSKGFQWFLSFYINFMEGSKGEFKNTALLLDDPGVHLHAEGQKNLLSTLEKLKENNQIIYATHSPFLIDTNHRDRIKILEKDDKGTVVKEKFYVSDFDALAPIRAAIGATIGDSLFTNKKNIIVEGFSDYLILEAISNYFKRTKKEFLDFSSVWIIHVGGAAKFPYFALLLEKENFRYVTVLDYDSQGRKAAKELKERYNVKEDIVIMLNECVSDEIKGGGRGRDIEIEDLIDESFYNKAVNEAYREIINKDITINELNNDTTKHTKKYVDFFKKNNFGGFDKVLVARQIGKMISDSSFNDKDLGAISMKNFERLFEIINERLA